jgi:acyl-coenzyme A thioesterase PaaI-like protein
MKTIIRFIEKAKDSTISLLLLNALLLRAIPFNKPHGLKIKEVLNGGFKIALPYKRKNLNHLKGIHACALAALAEYTAGLTLLYQLNSDEFRFIMKNLNVDFHFQAKTAVIASLQLDEEWIKTTILSPLEKTESVFTELKVAVYDMNQNHICTVTVNWQIKKWSAVKTAV